MKINVFGKELDALDVGATYVSGKRTPKNFETQGGLTPGIDDLPPETLDILAGYVDDLTHGGQNAPAGNEYPIDSTKDRITRYNVNDQGIPSVPAKIASKQNGTQFIDETDIPLLEVFPVATPNQNLVKKGKESRGQINGHHLLSDNVERVYTEYVSPLLRNNRFRPREGFNTPEINGPAPEATYHVNVDKHPTALGNYRAYVSETKELTAGHMSLVGPMLSLRSTQELMSTSDTGYGTDGPDGASADAAALLPGITQAGASKVSTNDLTALDALNSLIRGNADPANLNPDDFLNKHTVLSVARESYGNMNNVNEPFSGLAPLGTIALATALVIVLKQAMKGVLLVFGTITNIARPQRAKRNAQGRYILGHYVTTPGGGASSLFSGRLPSSIFGLTETIHEYNACVNIGLDSFFGGGIGDITKVLSNPGFYATLCRSIVRSSTEIVESVKNSLKGNPIHVIENIIGLVEVIKSSKVIGALNIFAQIGDNVLRINDNPNFLKKTSVNGEEIVDARTLTTIDAISDTNASGYKNRTSNGSSLAWRSSGTVSMLLAPQSLFDAIGTYLNQSGADGAVNGLSVISYSNADNIDKANQTSANIVGRNLGAQNRIDIGDVHKIETNLDAEYMPFYFHDLRTNEIISFPAFLRSLSDSYTVNTESGEFYGRVDPVKIYKSTSRSISMAFFIIATNEDDFDTMWLKINKLLTLIYPQWSEGSVLSDANGKQFIQPFSQIMTSSPLIRIRLGDVFRSNYSRFSLMRLFGVGGKYNIDPKVNYSVTSKAFEALQNFKLDLPKGAKYELRPGEYDSAPPSAGAALLASATSLLSSATGVSVLNVNGKDEIKIASNVLVEIVDKGDDATYIVKFSGDLSNLPVTKVPRSMLSWSQRANQANKKSSTQIGNPIPNSSGPGFFDKKENSIVRSFEEVGGKGLACMINSMNFEWLEYPWETEKYGGRAPKMCVVSLEITPIHDIAPGLDSNGFNRAPVYNVGNSVNEISGDAWDESSDGRSHFDKVKTDLNNKITGVGANNSNSLLSNVKIPGGI